MMQWVWLVPLLPLGGFVVALFWGQRRLRLRTPTVTLTLLGLAGVLAWLAFAQVIWRHAHGFPEASAAESGFDVDRSWTWFYVGNLPIKVGYLLDPLAACMLAMVTLVGWLIMLYSIGYMHQPVHRPEGGGEPPAPSPLGIPDPHYSRFFAYLSLFNAAMLGLVLANNFLLLFFCWELVGLCSYLLIGFWFYKRYRNPDLPQPAPSAKKAFIVTKLGDLGFFLGILLIFSQAQDFRYGPVFASARSWGPVVAWSVPVLLFCGAIGKSAQFPLLVWLPDAMAGPTPVSALIHAATMVAAGVYMVARAYPLFWGAPGLSFQLAGWPFQVTPLEVVAWVGGLTALMAATIAVLAWDIKKVLAYSTISQLGYMMLALGCGGYTAGTFHLLTHAFFKALLFLGSGSVIHACGHDENGEPIQDIRQMGGLGRAMPGTFWTFLIGSAALAGIPPLAGFWSKDEILLEVGFGELGNRLLFVMAGAAAFLTAFYMARLVWLTFAGDHPRNPGIHPHESPPVMLWPLRVLAGFALFMGLLGTPWGNLYHHFVHFPEVHSPEPKASLMLLSALIAGLGVLAGSVLYAPQWGMEGVRRRIVQPLAINPAYWLYCLWKGKYWLDEMWWNLLVVPMFTVMRALAWFDQQVVDGLVNLVGGVTVLLSRCWRLFDLYVVDGLVNAVGYLTRGLGEVGKFFQTGRVQNYALVVFVGVLAIILLKILQLQ